MNEIKRRKKGFLGLVLAAVMILGIPGGNLLAADYWVDAQGGPTGTPQLTDGTTVNNGDTIYHGSGSVTINYPNGTSDTKGGSNSVTGGPYVVTVSGDTVTLAYPAPTTPTTPTTPATPATPVVVVTPQPQVTDFYGNYLEELAKLIRAIKRPGGEIHNFGAGTSLTYAVLKTLAENPDDVLVFTTRYNDMSYTITIQGGAYINDLITPDIPWYGPLWLAGTFWQTTVIDPTK